MTPKIVIQNEDGFAVSAARLKEAAQTVLARSGVESSVQMTIVIADDDAVAALNRQFRGVDAPTDVLSFPTYTRPYLGDLIIAYRYAVQQAARLEHEFDDSFALLVVHGTLHLLGHDHDTPASRANMWTQQAAALSQLQIPLDIVPTLEDSDH